MSWKEKLKFNGDQEYSWLDSKFDEFDIARCAIGETESYVFHKKHTKGAHLRKLAQVPFHQIQWETPYYNKVLDNMVQIENAKDRVVLDFGCGDGRFTEYLLSKGFEKIVCVDFDYATLVSLSEFAKEKGYEDNLLIIHSDFENLPFNGEQFHLILSIGVLYYLNDLYEDSIQRFHDLILPNGQMITSDPEMEGFLLRSLIFDSLDEAIDTFDQRRFKETKEKTEYRFRVFHKDEWIQIFENAGFKVGGSQGISLFHNLLRILLLRGVIDESVLNENLDQIKSILDFLHDHGSLHKHKIWNLIKAG
jgi:2-polyprenyl-3-methyl-5-hydroxy-6-metoxy-1,4-benzoquinol methylase